MDSDESRPGSSASNSSDSSSNGPNNKIASPASERKSRSKSPASQKSGSRSSSSASSRDNSLEKSPEKDDRSNSPPVRRNSNGNRSVSRNQSISPARKSNSPKERSNSRNSTVSSVNLNPEEISDGEMESDKEDALLEPDDSPEKSKEALNISHEDLSDVSDLESTPSDNEKDDEEEDDEISAEKTKITDLRMRLDEKKNQLKSMDDKPENGTEIDSDKKNDEDALDFEAEEGECNEVVKEDKPEIVKEIEEKKNESDGEAEEGEELEEGEVTDGDEKRPEENEPKPVCRFYTRGQCTWGMSCRFLHPGVTDKGNYTMFDMVRPVPVPHGAGPYGPPGGAYHEYRNERPPLHHAPPHPGYGAPAAHPRGAPQPEAAAESAWERGLRTAKEMMRKANKRKEQDMDFEDKKMNLSLSQDELEKDNYYTRDRASPEPPITNNVELSPPYGRPPAPAHYEAEPYSPPPKFPPRGAAPPFEEDPYARGAPRYRELPAHRMPQYEDEVIGKPRRIRPAREVIVQRAEPSGRADDWNDPWMRSKSPGRGGEKRSRRDRRSYSSNSSYSSSSSSRSQTSSDTSRSPSPATRRRRYDSHQSKEAAPSRYNKSPGRRPHHGKGVRSPTPKRRSPGDHPENRIINELPPPNKKFTNNIHNRKNSENDFVDRKLMPPPPIPNSLHQLKNFGPRRSPPATKRGDKRIISPTQHEKRAERVPITGPIQSKRKRPISPPTANSKKPGQTTATDRNNKVKKRKTSSSGSSDSSGSDSDSSYSGSSSDSSHSPNSKTVRRDKLAPERKPALKKVEMSKKRPTPPTPAEPKSSQSIPSSNQTPASAAPSVNSKKTTRREELLKQLKAVEEAIARKRSKI